MQFRKIIAAGILGLLIAILQESLLALLSDMPWLYVDVCLPHVQPVSIWTQ
jgi:hypothetical protein